MSNRGSETALSQASRGMGNQQWTRIVSMASIRWSLSGVESELKFEVGVS